MGAWLRFLQVTLARLKIDDECLRIALSTSFEKEKLSRAASLRPRRILAD